MYGLRRIRHKARKYRRFGGVRIILDWHPAFTLLRLVLCIFTLNINFVKKLLVVFAEFLRNDYVIVIDEIFLLVYRVIIDEPHTGNHERIERRNDYRADAEREKQH